MRANFPYFSFVAHASIWDVRSENEPKMAGRVPCDGCRGGTDYRGKPEPNRPASSLVWRPFITAQSYRTPFHRSAFEDHVERHKRTKIIVRFPPEVDLLMYFGPFSSGGDSNRYCSYWQARIRNTANLEADVEIHKQPVHSTWKTHVSVR
jgi:hypothetical protein